MSRRRDNWVAPAWTPPATLTCVLLEPNHVGAVLSAFPDCLQTPVEDAVAVLVPDATRPVLMRAVTGTSAIVGPTVAWQRAADSYRRALALAELWSRSGRWTPRSTSWTWC
ncbi:MAG: hypothetical protein V9E82_00500 [Candidatus Nanopelagicales bacterium]